MRVCLLSSNSCNAIIFCLKELRIHKRRTSASVSLLQPMQQFCRQLRAKSCHQKKSVKTTTRASWSDPSSATLIPQSRTYLFFDHAKFLIDRFEMKSVESGSVKQYFEVSEGDVTNLFTNGGHEGCD